MELKFKNKHIMALEKLIQEGENKGGIPDHIDLYPKEGYALLYEIHSLINNESHKSILKELFSFEPEIQILRQENLDKTIAYDTLELWFKGTYKIFYKGVRLVVMNEPKPKVPMPKGPPNREVKEVMFEVPSWMRLWQWTKK